MEYSKSGWDFLFWPRTWHKRLNKTILTLIPACIFVGIFDVLATSPSIVYDYILTAESKLFTKILLAIVLSALVGFLDVFIFAWPIADLCRYLAKRREKFIVQGFHIILMKSYAYSHLLFIPVLLLNTPTGLHIENLDPQMPFFKRLLIIVLVVYASMQLFWQIGILLRTISVKSKLEFSGKLIVTIAIFIWSNLSGTAIIYLLQIIYRLFLNLDKVS
jgi:hypothetical protein